MGQTTAVVLRAHPQREAELAEITQAVRGVGPGLGAGQRGQEQPGQDSDDGDDHQQFDEGEADGR